MASAALAGYHMGPTHCKPHLKNFFAPSYIASKSFHKENFQLIYGK